MKSGFKNGGLSTVFKEWSKGEYLRCWDREGGGSNREALSSQVRCARGEEVGVCGSEDFVRQEEEEAWLWRAL